MQAQFQTVYQCLYDFRMTRSHINSEWSKVPLSESLKRYANLAVRIAAFVATPLAAIATIFLAVTIPPLAVVGLAATVLLHDVYQLTRAVEYYEYRIVADHNWKTLTMHTYVFKYLPMDFLLQKKK